MTKSTILIVDDDPIVLASISKVLAPVYQVRVANSGARALLVAQSEPVPDLILLDVMMPEMDGYVVLSSLMNNPETNNITVIFVTGMESEDDEAKGLALGAVDYITKPIRPEILLARVKTHLSLKLASDFLQDKNIYLEAEVTRRTAENQAIQNASIHALAHLAETRDSETGHHLRRTQSYVKVLARQLQSHPRFSATMTDSYIELVTRSAPLHDIGKVGIPDKVLLKQDSLDEYEWGIMKTHAELGARAIERAERDVDAPIAFLRLAKEIAHWHHEHWDGSGYPDGLVGDDIPVSARLMAIADVFDALISERVYKVAMTDDKAREIILSGRGSQFDPDICDAFLLIFDEFVQISQQYKDVG